MKAYYRKYNDRSQNSSTYHKKDGTNIRSILKNDLQMELYFYNSISTGINNFDL